MLSLLLLCTLAACSQFAALHSTLHLGLTAFLRGEPDAVEWLAVAAVFQAATLGLLVIAWKLGAA